MIKAVLFDLDNTLIDFMKMKKLSCEQAIAAMRDAGLPLTEEEATKELFELYDKHGIEYRQIFQEFLTKTMGKIDWKILASGVIAYRKVKNGFLEPYPHVIPTLLRLKENGYKIGVVSDAPRFKAWLRIAAMRVADFFDVVVTTEDADGELKPSPKPYLVALEKLKLKPKEVMFVGDNPERDIDGANRIGMVTVLAKYGNWSTSTKGVKPNHEIDDIQDLLKILDKNR